MRRSCRHRAGSPPRLRGEGRGDCKPLCNSRITPAPAGRSRLTISAIACPWDHPRACGEKEQGKENNIMKRGSPPRLRGEDCTLYHIGGAGRITPAPAGRRVDVGKIGRALEDHPRACGEKNITL